MRVMCWYVIRSWCCHFGNGENYAARAWLKKAGHRGLVILGSHILSWSIVHSLLPVCHKVSVPLPYASICFHRRPTIMEPRTDYCILRALKPWVTMNLSLVVSLSCAVTLLELMHQQSPYNLWQPAFSLGDCKLRNLGGSYSGARKNHTNNAWKPPNPLNWATLLVLPNASLSELLSVGRNLLSLLSLSHHVLHSIPHMNWSS